MDNSVSQIFKLIICNGEKILTNINVVARRQDKRETAHFQLPSASQKRRLLKLPIKYNHQAIVVMVIVLVILVLILMIIARYHYGYHLLQILQIV